MSVLAIEVISTGRILTLLADRSLGLASLQENLRRTGASKLYYGLFHLALELAIENGRPANGSKSRHTQLWNWYKSRTDTKDLATIGFELKQIREHADYDLEESFFYTGDELFILVHDAFKLLEKERQRT